MIGLFGNFTQQASASPLAVAFLVGYAVEVFFTFLEGLSKLSPGTCRPPPRTGAGCGRKITVSAFPRCLVTILVDGCHSFDACYAAFRHSPIDSRHRIGTRSEIIR